MILDHSGAKMWWECPLKFFERYDRELEPAWDREYFEFGRRIHELQACHYAASSGGAASALAPYPPHQNEAIEAEAQAMMAAYKQHYPVEPFTVLEVEKTHVVPVVADVCEACGSLSGEPYRTDEKLWFCNYCSGLSVRERHKYAFKCDLLAQDAKTGQGHIVDHKSEKRNSYGNTAQAWASRHQVSLYQWASRQLRPDLDMGAVIINVLTRQSPKGREGPMFRRERPFRTPEQEREAIAWLVRTADLIEQCRRTGNWPANRNNCVDGRYACDYFDLHNDYGEGKPDLEQLIQIKFRKAVPYLEL